ncbi:glycoside hydrolase family 3 C-terminal domain-containing protein [Dactylosporangium sucinum]|uniref:Exo-alpha-(1->6)-L-arabinopyranosidase n=1 Tax=Dactylosporangium sucinum TaxID=1424081 RepID=A0A917UEH9_9ACTN|nr:glycoside hydrolase family 3 C-terminal domain-containing protein [Dactylosporangium sucinum]GGM82800.1 hypothetical protein GCM10007977_100290 [Dactylosporangium sucinum]
MDEAVDDIPAAVEAARNADVAVVAVGERSGWIGDATGGEGRSRADLRLLGRQTELLNAVADTGTAMVVVLFSGRPLVLGAASERAAAVIVAWHPGPFGGVALGEALWGVGEPGGRLPITFPRGVGQVPMYSGHSSGSGYRCAEGPALHPYIDSDSTPRYPFGHGLSFASFEWSEFEASTASAECGATVSVSLRVTNTSRRDGAEVVQLYGFDHCAGVTRPVRQLLGFSRVEVPAGGAVRVTFDVDTSLFAWWDSPRRWVVEPGPVELMLARSADDVVWRHRLALTGPELSLDRRRAFYSVGRAS